MIKYVLEDVCTPCKSEFYFYIYIYIQITPKTCHITLIKDTSFTNSVDEPTHNAHSNPHIYSSSCHVYTWVF